MAEKLPERITINLDADDWKAILARIREETGRGRVVTPQDVLREAVKEKR
jgi:hypothetical protein